MASLFALPACTPSFLRDLAQGAGEAVEAAASVMKPSQTESEDSLFLFLADAEEGDVRDLDDSATGIRLRVTAGRTYHAASGQLCRRYDSERSAAAPEAKGEGLVCRDASGRWTRAGLLAPVSP